MLVTLIILLVLNVFLVAAMVFLERKKPQSILVWTLVFLVLPGVGFLLYAMLGNGLSFKTRKMLKSQSVMWNELKALVCNQKQEITNEELKSNKLAENNKNLILLNIDSCSSVYTENNKITLFTRGEDKLKSLLEDLANAKQSINLCYYIFASDKTGEEVCAILMEKAKQGVVVNLLIDAFGSKRFSRKKLKELKESGVNACEFFPPLKIFRNINLRLNYRNHRKIVVIDGKVAYIGGMNLRDDHMERSNKKLEWRDDHIRVVGDCVFDLQRLFLKDWRYSFLPARQKDYKLESFFSFNDEVVNNCGVQIIHSGPDDDREQIKLAMIKMITNAKSKICLQSPYFVPDDSFLDALKVAALSGVEVNVMIPSVPDKIIPYYASLSYCDELTRFGVNVYVRQGFLHAKTLVVDDGVCMIGSCNSDIRSFSLNFEASAVVYDKTFGGQLSRVFKEDCARSELLNADYFKNLPRGKKALKSICRLFSGVL